MTEPAFGSVLDGCVRWCFAEAFLAHNGEPYTLCIFRDSNSLLNAFFVIENYGQIYCAIPLSQDTISGLFDKTRLIMTFKEYENISISFLFDDFKDAELIITQIRQPNISVQDPLYSNNLQFLRSISLKEFTDNLLSTPDIRSFFTSIYETQTYYSPLTEYSLSTSLYSHEYEIWKQRLLVINSGYICHTSDFRVSFLTWNVASVKPKDDVINSFRESFKVGKDNADLVFIALQEIDMGVKSIVVGSSKVSGQWSNIVHRSISDTPFQLLQESTLGGVYTAAIVRSNTEFNITCGPVKTIRMGAMGIAANKGACIFPIRVGSTKFAFIGCHLSPHTEHWESRNAQIRQLLKITDGNYDYLAIVGDLNYRLTIGYEEAVNLAGTITGQIPEPLPTPEEKKKQKGESHKRKPELKEDNSTYEEKKKVADQFLDKDQLKITMDQDQIIGRLKEAEIAYLPTYKFDKDSDNYDTSSKRRVPSYTDRVLITRGPKRLALKPQNEIVTEIFGSPIADFPVMPHCVGNIRGRSRFSDHRSVNAAMIFKIPIVDLNKVKEVEKAIEKKIEQIGQLSKPTLIGKFNEEGIVLENTGVRWVAWKTEEKGCQPSQGIIFPGKSVVVKVEKIAPVVFEIKKGDKLEVVPNSNQPQNYQNQQELVDDLIDF